MKIPNGYIQTEDGLWLRPAFLKLTPEEKKRICNGIGAASGISKHIPDTIWGLNCKKAGDIHDYDYYVGGTVTDRRIADMVFLHNLYKIIKGGCWLFRIPRRMRARTYYATLRLCGFAHFNFRSDSCRASDNGEAVKGYPTFEESPITIVNGGDAA